ncbi:hypothetical protein BDA99DRAFT_556877 [Phascolomyces articulosus]|uniref:Heterokaryon incompatibility domain-containing protein n=1 Tax=Phascolomyces articulosus TaxID=60185 RepID=A0AAD5KI00_9FUNG|nr:hypothetical protein BDA99DRAFT_556877 [Phascolomyces articulosus]
MYITYETTQYSWNNRNELAKHVKPPITIPNVLPKPNFMPSKLVCISDMKVVDGSQVNEGYCALSYSWNQSGDIKLDDNGKYVRVDDGKHKIISYDNIFPDMIIPQYKVPLNYKYESIETRSKLSKIYHVLEIIDGENYNLTKATKQVKFEGIIQKICQQFNIKYIWYDQLCIDQNNKEEKHHEIRNMHHIYEHAYCTVALVPDYPRNHSLRANEQQYFNRLWTLEEAIKSKRLIFVGKNMCSYGSEFVIDFSLKSLLKPLSQLSTPQILYHAHQRTCTNKHDRIFALIHLFPEFIDRKDEPQSFKKLIVRYFCGPFSTENSINKIHIDYRQPFEDLMIQFYGLLAKKDISILLFGNYKHIYESAIKEYKFLPSWTGVNGKHFTLGITTSFQNYDIIGKTMHVTTTYVPSIDDNKLTIREEDIPTIPDYINNALDKRKYHLFILVQLSKAKEMKRIDLDYYGFYWDIDGKPFFDQILKNFNNYQDSWR